MKTIWITSFPVVFALILIPAIAGANSGDFAGGVAIGNGYAGISSAPTNGLIVQGNVGVGTTSPANALDIGTSGGLHITTGIPSSTSMALYNNSGTLTWNGIALATGSSVSGTTGYIPVFTGSNSLGNSIMNESGGSVTVTGGLTVTGVASLGNGSTAVTQSAGDNSTKIATTAYVDNASGSTGGSAAGNMIRAAMTITSTSSSATFTADQIVVATSLGGSYKTLSSYSETIDLSTTGAGGMDTGSPPTNGYVSIYAIDGASGTSILASTSTSSDGTIYSGGNMPAGYTYSALISSWRVDGSGDFIPGIQKDRHIVIVPVTALSGGTQINPTAVSVASAVPPNAVALDATLSAFYVSSVQWMNLFSDLLGSNQISTSNAYPNAAVVRLSAINQPMAVPQTIYYNITNTGITANFSVVGYWF